jgi:hemolysin-activating ACP:hemolysin acyltransferase
MQRSDEAMIFFASLKKNRYISVFSVTKPKNFVVFAFTNVAESSALLNDDFCMTSHNVDSNEAIFLPCVKRFIAVTF